LSSPLERDDSSRGFQRDKAASRCPHAKPFRLILSILAIYTCYALRALRWKVFQQNLGPSHFGTIYAMTLAGFAAVFLLGRAGRAGAAAVAGAKRKAAGVRHVWRLCAERLFDTASAAVIAAVALLLFRSHTHAGETASRLETAARTTGSLLFAGVIGAVAFLVYLRLHGTALLERQLQGWLKAHGWRGNVAGILLGLRVAFKRFELGATWR